MKFYIQPEPNAENAKAPLVPGNAISIAEIKDVLSQGITFPIEVATDGQSIECRSLSQSDGARQFRCYLHFAQPPFDTGKTLNISGLKIVDPTNRRKGLGRTFLGNIVRLALRTGYEGLSLGASEEGGLFWAKAGFRADSFPPKLSSSMRVLEHEYPHEIASLRAETDPALAVWKAGDLTIPDALGEPLNRRLLIDVDWMGKLLFSDQEAMERLCRFLKADPATLGLVANGSSAQTKTAEIMDKRPVPAANKTHATGAFPN